MINKQNNNKTTSINAHNDSVIIIVFLIKILITITYQRKNKHRPILPNTSYGPILKI